MTKASASALPFCPVSSSLLDVPDHYEKHCLCHAYLDHDCFQSCQLFCQFAAATACFGLWIWKNKQTKNNNKKVIVIV